MSKTKGLVKKETTNKITFGADQVELIKKTMAVGASDDELKLFLYQCQRTGLDPLARQMYFIKRAGRVTIQTSIDGFRVVADRSGNYAGQDEPDFSYSATDTTKKMPIKCSVKVYKFGPGGVRYPAGVGVAIWNEYKPAPGQDFMWNKMPHTMLSKVAEALALRKAFPQDLSGIYVQEEMDQVETGKIVEPVKPEKVIKKTVKKEKVVETVSPEENVDVKKAEEQTRIARIDFIKKLVKAKEITLPEGKEVDKLTYEETQTIKDDYLKVLKKN